MPIAPDLAGSALAGRYELHAVIGEGTFGRVYRGWDRRLERAVAVKVIKPWWGEDADWAGRFEREARLLARVSHPGIVQIHDVGQGEEGLFYVAELVEGESLAARLRRGPLEPREAARVAAAFSAALAHMHACGVVHRDVKPANVLLGPAGQVKVADLGIARLADGSSEGPATMAGTPRYMAPEQAQGRPATPRTDVYSAGVVLYEMLAGHTPFAGATPVEVALHHLTDPPSPLPRTVPVGLAAVVLRALAKAPEDRYADAGELAAALGAADLDADGTWVAPRFGPRRTANPSARRRAAALVAAVAAVAAVMFVLAGLLSGGAGRARAPQAAVPALVSVPALDGSPALTAARALTRLRLTARVVAAPAPGLTPGTVSAQTPAAGARVTAGAVVVLHVAAAPRWRTVAVVGGQGAGHTPVVRIRGTRWRLSTSMDYVGTCTFVVFCDGPTAHVTAFPAGTSTSFDLAHADGRVVAMPGGPGQYEVAVTPGNDTAAWRVAVQDLY